METPIIAQLKKQVKQLKAELMHRTSTAKSSSKNPAGRIQELEYEIEVYREELLRLRSLLPPPSEAQGKESESDQSHNLIAAGQQQRMLLDEVSPNVSSHVS